MTYNEMNVICSKCETLVGRIILGSNFPNAKVHIAEIIGGDEDRFGCTAATKTMLHDRLSFMIPCCEDCDTCTKEDEISEADLEEAVNGAASEARIEEKKKHEETIANMTDQIQLFTQAGFADAVVRSAGALEKVVDVANETMDKLSLGVRKAQQDLTAAVIKTVANEIQPAIRQTVFPAVKEDVARQLRDETVRRQIIAPLVEVVNQVRDTLCQDVARQASGLVETFLYQFVDRLENIVLGDDRVKTFIDIGGFVPPPENDITLADLDEPDNMDELFDMEDQIEQTLDDQDDDIPF